MENRTIQNMRRVRFNQDFVLLVEKPKIRFRGLLEVAINAILEGGAPARVIRYDLIQPCTCGDKGIFCGDSRFPGMDRRTLGKRTEVPQRTGHERAYLHQRVDLCLRCQLPRGHL